LPILFSFSPNAGNQQSIDRLPIQLGLPIIYSLFLLFKNKRFDKLSYLFILLLLISFPIWNFIPKVFYSIQFPYRLVGFFLLLICIFISTIKESKITNGIYILFIIISAFSYLRYSYSYTPSIFSYNANYRNSFYFFKNAWNGNGKYATDTFTSVSKKLFSKSSIIINKTSQKTLFVKTCNGSCTNTIWFNSKASYNLKDVYLHIYLISNQKKNDDIIKMPLNQLGSFCVTNDIKSILFELVNFSTNKNLTLDEINIYEASNKIRPVQINNQLILSTCAINKYKDSIDFIFDEKSTLPKALPYYYSTENIVMSKGKVISDTIPGLDKLGNSYTLILKNNNIKFTIKDSFFPKNILERLKSGLFN